MLGSSKLIAGLLLASLGCTVGAAHADNTAQVPPFSQNWTNIGLITVTDNWSGVPSIEGFRGDGLTAALGTDPQTILASDTPGVLDVNANQTAPNTFATGGATEFHLTDPVVALAGSGTATAPYIKLYLNTTGQSSITLAYNVRDLDGSIDNAIQQLALQFRLGNSGNFTNVPAGYIADGSTGPSLATLVTPVCAVLPAAANNQPLVEVRIMTSNATGNDEWLGIDDLVVNTAGCAVGSTLNISDVTLAEGDPPGTTTYTFAVTLTSPAGPGGVTFDIATADGTAQDDNPIAEDNDYVAQSLTGQTIPMGSTGPYNFSVTVNRDTTPEPNETFFVNVTNLVGATPGDIQGQGTINNDDIVITLIHDVQGPGASSPIVGASVTIRGIVTGVKSNGFFVQEEDADVDADPSTSEGIFVFTSAAPPAAAAVGNYVEVTGTIAEFVPTADLLQPPLTELTSPTVVQLTTGNPLPAPVSLSATFPDPAGTHDQLERLEGMRVSVASLTVGGPTLGNSINEPNATVTSNGVFYGVVTGVARAFREPGIQAPDPAPSGATIPPIPRWDTNPEVLRVDSDGLTGAPILDVGVSAVVTGLVGPLDYTLRRYTVLPDPTLPAPVAAGGATATVVTAPTAQEFTVASYNLQRFFDTVNDPGIGEPVLTAVAFDNRLNKASLAIRNHLQAPDILGVQEVENLSVLQDLAITINNDAVANAQPNPMYVAFLAEGNDIGGIDVGFLVKTSVVFSATPRVTVNAVVQESAAELFVNADSSTELLNDRPPLRLDAVVNFGPTVSYPVTVIVNHLRSLNGANDESAGGSGWPTVGSRVRAKRLKQAESLANLVQTRQTGNPAENIVLVGDFNAFPFNDGLTDSMDVIAGTPVPDNETAVSGDGIDLVNPDLDNLDDTPSAAERYSYVFDGNAQSLDHVLVNGAVVTTTSARRIEHPRINADFPEIDRNNSTTARRLSDHDPLVAFLALPDAADLSLTKTDSPDPVVAGTNLTYTLTVTNAGPSAAANASFSDPLPAGTTFVSLPAVAGWSCTTPAVGAGGTVSCSNPSFAAGSAVFTLTVAVDPALAAGTVLSNTATATSTTADPVAGNESATETTTVSASADLQIAKTDTPDPVTAGTNLTYQITLTNNGPSNAASATFSDTLPAGTTFVSLATTGSWSCTTPAVGGAGTVSCANASFGVTVDFFTLVVNVDSTTAAGTILSNTATIASTTTDPVPGNDSATATTTVTASADVSLTKTLDTAGPYTIGQSVTYTIVVANAGPSTATNINVTDTPTNLTITNVSGACASFSPCTIASLASGANTNITVTATIDSSGAFSNSATATAVEADPNPSDNTASDGDIASQTNLVEVTKAVSGTFVQGTNVTYTVVMTNTMSVNQPDNFGHEFTDILPAGLTLVPASFTATSGTTGSIANIFFWDGSIPSGGTVTLTFQATISATATGQICNQGESIFDKDGDAQNESSELTDDPSTAAVNDPTCFNVVQSNPVEVTKAVSGTFVQGTNVTYTVVMTNTMSVNQPDNFGHEFTDILPAGLTLVPASFTATSGTTGSVANIFFWDGSIPSGGTVTLTFQATISPSATGQICNQGESIFDKDGDAQNESSELTDDPSTAAVNDSTCFTVQTSADLSVGVSDTPDPVTAGSDITYTITVNSAGPSAASNATLSDTLPAGTTFVSLTSAAGWTCTTPAVGATGSVNCTIASLAAGDAVFTLVLAVDPGVAGGTVINNSATAASATTDPNPGNNSDSTTTTVGSGSADLSVTKTAAPNPVTAGGNLTYTITANNLGPSAAANVVLSDTLPAGTTFVSLTAAAGYTCTTPAVGAAGTISCTRGSMPIVSDAFTLVVQVGAAVAGGTVISNTATVSSATPDPTPGNNSATAISTVNAPAIVSGSKTAGAAPSPGGPVTYTIVLSNSGSGTQGDNAGDEFTDVLPSSLALVSASASSGTAVANVGTNTVSWNGSIAVGGTVTITIQATVLGNVAPGSSITNQGTIRFDADGNGSNEATAPTDDPGTGTAGDGTAFVVAQGVIVPAPTPRVIPTTSLPINLLLSAMLALIAFAGLRRRAR